jgi:hypothetical protein
MTEDKRILAKRGGLSRLLPRRPEFFDIFDSFDQNDRKR